MLPEVYPTPEKFKVSDNAYGVYGVGGCNPGVIGIEFLVGLRGLSGLRSSEMLLRYVGDMSGLEISMLLRSDSVGLRLPEPRKSFLVENLRARLDPPEEEEVVAAFGVGKSGVGRGYHEYVSFEDEELSAIGGGGRVEAEGGMYLFAGVFEYRYQFLL